ncbi:CHRD domain-containing protein [Candidatus Woesearchaeota archaeon]|nr:CHRD domain-containing protein [Candidatus Woesearchaeota archaeon]
MKAILTVFVAVVLLGAFSFAQADDIEIETALSGANEVPVTNSTATGEAAATLDGSQLTVKGSFEGLSSELVSGASAHIHEGVTGTNGPIVFNLNVVAGDDNRSGEFSLTANLTDGQVNDLLTGQYYINVHSTAFPDGEIRGQFAAVNQTPQVNQTQNQTANVTTQVNAGVDLHIMKWYPKGPDYVFTCNATGFTPTSYSWFYGDGHKLLNIVNRHTYHVYETLGNKTVSCTAFGDNISVSDTLQIDVTSLARPLHPLFGASNATDNGRTFSCTNVDNSNPATCACQNSNENAASCKCTENR